MYRCDVCNTIVGRAGDSEKGFYPTHQPMIKVVIQTRPRVYPQGGQGFETVKEVKVCSKCAAKLA